MTNIRVTPGELVDTTWLNLTARGAYRKTSAVQVVNTVVETDLLGGSITLAAGVLGSTGVVRLTTWGDWINNTGANQVMARFKLKLGATTLFDTGTAGAASWIANAGRFGWRIQCETLNLGVTNSQWATFDGRFSGSIGNNIFSAFTTGEGVYGTTASDFAFAVGGTSGAVDTTVAQVLALTVTNPVANALLDVTLKGALVEII